MDTIFSLAMLRAISGGEWDFAAYDLWDWSPAKANTEELHDAEESYRWLFLQSFLGLSTGDNARVIPITLFLYPGFNQRIMFSMAYVGSNTQGIPTSMGAYAPTQLRITSSQIGITGIAWTNATYRLYGSIIAII